jgi:hypothetical protein
LRDLAMLFAKHLAARRVLDRLLAAKYAESPRRLGAGAKTPSNSGWRSPLLPTPSSPSKARISRMFPSLSTSQVSFPE